MTTPHDLKTFGVIDPGANVLLEVIRAESPVVAVRRMEEKMRGPEYVAARRYDIGGEEALDGADTAYLVYGLDGSGLDAEGLGGDDAGRVRAEAGVATVIVSALA
ncbi:hypothetical protein [Acetobacter vaccinii]|uniref:Uncharacterized protein n=1 Tax=Acetobacter vaccinii TaxID=2592655 RepID=A0A5C1YLZ4_9PROT|nr:hypothetical protein [Acetobacter vaccinii]QEO16518.1 hypothetical protein FLP30_01040 [Acetobacter vaccinii]